METPLSDRALFLRLLVAGSVGVLAGIPYTLVVIEDPAFAGSLDRSWVWRNAVFEALILLAAASAVGVWIGKRVGLGPRLPEAMASKPTLDRVGSILIIPAAIGLALAVPVLLAELTASDQIYRFDLQALTPAAWLLRSLSAALTEEIAFRLGLMTLFVWIVQWIARRPAFDGLSLWIGNLLSALLFAAAHLSGAGEAVVAVFVFNALAGLLMGWLYQSRGLLAAVVAHFVADAVRVIQVL